MSNDEVILPKQYALVLLRKLADDDAFRTAYAHNPAQALRSIGVPENLIASLPANYGNLTLDSKAVFQTGLYQLIDEVARVSLCQRPPQISLGIGERSAGSTTSFEGS